MPRPGVSAHGKLYGCNKAGGGAQFTASFVMSQATCANLSMSGVAQFDWADGGQSTVFPRVSPTGQRTEEAVRERLDHRRARSRASIVSAWVRFTEVFNGSGVNCSSSNRLQQIRFSNTQSFQLLTPNVATTTTPPATSPPTTRTAADRSGHQPGHGSGDQPGHADTKPVTVIIVRRGRGGVVVVRRRSRPARWRSPAAAPVAALLALEALLIGGALVMLDPERKKRRGSRMGRRRPKSFLRVTLPK